MPITQATFYWITGKHAGVSGTRLQYDNRIWKEISRGVRVNALPFLYSAVNNFQNLCRGFSLEKFSQSGRLLSALLNDFHNCCEVIDIALVVKGWNLLQPFIFLFGKFDEHTLQLRLRRLTKSLVNKCRDRPILLCQIIIAFESAVTGVMRRKRIFCIGL